MIDNKIRHQIQDTLNLLEGADPKVKAQLLQDAVQTLMTILAVKDELAAQLFISIFLADIHNSTQSDTIRLVNPVSV